MVSDSAWEWRWISVSQEATESLGQALGAVLEPGTVLALSGDLGAGKTCFVRGLARGLGVPDTVSSPTYILMQAYDGRLPLYHFDAWMEGREKSLFLDGGDEWLYGAGVAVVEWAERVDAWLPEPRIELRLSHLGPTERGLDLRVVHGPGDGESLGRLIRSLTLPEGVSEASERGKDSTGIG